MPPDPLISVIMPAFNAVAYLTQAIDSILSQTYANFELIILNDGSTDQTDGVIKAFTDTRIRYFENQSNLGLVATLNLGLAAARGQYIARMDADDISFPVRFERQINYLESHPSIGVVGSAVQLIDESNRRLRLSRFPLDPDLVRWILIFTNPVAHPSVMMRKSIIQSVGGYRHCRAEDIDLWERLIQVTQISNLSTVLLKLRKHNRNITHVDRAALITSAAEISERMIERSIGQAVPTDLVAKMYGNKIEVPSDSLEIAILIDKLYRVHGSNPRLNPEARRCMRLDAARRVLRLATQDDLPLHHREQLIYRACVLDPLVPFRALISRTSSWMNTNITR